MENINFQTKIGSFAPKLHLILGPSVQKHPVAYFEIASVFFLFFFQPFYHIPLMSVFLLLF